MSATPAASLVSEHTSVPQHLIGREQPLHSTERRFDGKGHKNIPLIVLRSFPSLGNRILPQAVQVLPVLITPKLRAWILLPRILRSYLFTPPSHHRLRGHVPFTTGNRSKSKKNQAETQPHGLLPFSKIKNLPSKFAGKDRTANGTFGRLSQIRHRQTVGCRSLARFGRVPNSSMSLINS